MTPAEKNAVEKLKKAETKRSRTWKRDEIINLYSFKINGKFGFPFGAKTDKDALKIWNQFKTDNPLSNTLLKDVDIFRIGQYNSDTARLYDCAEKVVVK